MDTIRQVFNATPWPVQMGFMAVIAAAIFGLLLYGLAAAGLKQAGEMIASLQKEPNFTMTEEAKGEAFAQVTAGIWIGLLINAALTGSIDGLVGGFIIWTVITVCGLLVWALRQGSK